MAGEFDQALRTVLGERQEALALAGGPTLAGSTRSIKVKRGGQEVQAKLDDPVKPEDVLIIREKLF